MYHILPCVKYPASLLSRHTLIILIENNFATHFLPLEYKTHESRTHVSLTDGRLLLWEIEGSVVHNARRQRRPPKSLTERGRMWGINPLPTSGHGVRSAYYRYSDDLLIPLCSAHRQGGTFVTRVTLCQRLLRQRLGTRSW